MDPKKIRELLENVAKGRTSVEAALSKLRDLPFADLGFAAVDHHRAMRLGLPEVVFAPGKSIEQLIAIVREIDSHDQPALATRITREQATALKAAIPEVEYDPTASTAVLTRAPIPPRGRGTICIVTAGTSDIPVASEAAVTAAVFGNAVSKLFDVGVAGMHRLLGRKALLDEAAVIIVVAGMEGALASVIGGLVDKPVIAVPTSIGYGASFGGIAALLGMLNSCASGVTVVNIDNGFGAAYAATLINRCDEK
ncbi:MAG: nickel pincer cofactor biosynthesis protein LarB [Deltaproteobacteria bacterium]|nr:nickel pincer cofactor biosynthesis protein LarB [Deltaproteobacteria bacterium]